MHRCCSGLLFTLNIALVVSLAGCLGKSSSNTGNAGVRSVSLSPSSSISIDVGSTQVFSASGKNADGTTVIGPDIHFIVSVPSGSTGAAPLSVASNGNACAGTWDSTSTICSPGIPGVATVTAVIQGVSSPVTTVYVHQHIDSIQVSRLDPQGPPRYDCFSQGQVWGFQANAFSNNVDITNSVGPMTWSSTNFGVVTPTPLVLGQAPNQQFNQVQVTAKTPGITNIFANASGVTSNFFPYTTCLVQAIYLQLAGQGEAGNSTTVNTGTGVSITATAIDTLFNLVSFAPLAQPPLTWSTSNPEVVAFTSITNDTGTNIATTRANLGGAAVFASCGPPTCNIGVLPGLPIYSSDGVLPNGEKGYGTISIDVTSTDKAPNYTAWAATTDCGDALGCTSALFSVTPNTTGVNPIGTIISLPRTPNSMMFNHLAAARLYIGSDQGLMFVDVTGNSTSPSLVSRSSTPCNVALCGKVLTISNDGKLVVVADTVSTPRQVYIYNSSNTNLAPVDLILDNTAFPGETATKAAFSPDQLKVFILTDKGNLYVYSTVDALASVHLAATATDVSFSADGSFAYLSGTPASSVSAYSTCSLPNNASVDIGSVATSSNPVRIFPSPVIPAPVAQGGFLWTTQNVYALEPPNIEFLTVQQFRQDPILYQAPLQFTCNPPVIPPGKFTKGQSFNLGQGSFTPLFAQLVNDGNQIVIVAQGIPAVLIFNVNDGTTTSIPLAGGSTPMPGQYSASVSTDGSQVFVDACDKYTNNDPNQPCTAGSVHIINTVTQGDFLQVPYFDINNSNTNMCNNQGTAAPVCLPNLIAIKPQ